MCATSHRRVPPGRAVRVELRVPSLAQASPTKQSGHCSRGFCDAARPAKNVITVRPNSAATLTVVRERKGSCVRAASLAVRERSASANWFTGESRASRATAKASGASSAPAGRLAGVHRASGDLVRTWLPVLFSPCIRRDSSMTTGYAPNLETCALGASNREWGGKNHYDAPERPHRQ
jgi:hypothetical protein